MAHITCIEDFRKLARRRIPRAIFDYADGGAYDERTLRSNRASLEAIRLRQRVMSDVSGRVLSTTLAGEPATIPVAIAPTGLTGLFHGDGEIHGARAAQAFGVPFCLSTMSICSIEDVRAAVDKPFWFQLYLMRDRGFVRSLIERAIAAECSALVLTVDLPLHGQRHRDIRNGLSIPPRLTLDNALDTATKLGWAKKVLFGKRRTFGNLEGRLGKDDGLTTLAQWTASQFDPTLNWKDLEWVRSIWPGKIILKGVLDAEDARQAAEAGCTTIVVSNHGGRQLDDAPATIAVLPEIVDAVGDRVEILFDGGIMSGQSVLKALASGARGCLIGKAFLYSLAAMGEDGVLLALEILKRELDVSMALTGQRDVTAISPDVLWRPAAERSVPPFSA